MKFFSHCPSYKRPQLHGKVIEKTFDCPGMLLVFPLLMIRYLDLKQAVTIYQVIICDLKISQLELILINRKYNFTMLQVKLSISRVIKDNLLLKPLGQKIIQYCRVNSNVISKENVDLFLIPFFS